MSKTIKLDSYDERAEDNFLEARKRMIVERKRKALAAKAKEKEVTPIDSMIGLACGDAYGFPYEFVDVRYEDLPDHTNSVYNMMVSDDTEMTLIALSHLKKNGRFNIKKLEKEYQTWAGRYGDGCAIGTHTKAVLLHGKQDKASQGNGALMRCIPYALYLHEQGTRREKIHAIVKTEASITHDEPFVHDINRMFVDIAIDGLDAIDEDISKTCETRFGDGKLGWVVNSTHIVLSALKQDLSIIEAFKFITSHKHSDADTDCAIYGALVGCDEPHRFIDNKTLLRMQTF